MKGNEFHNMTDAELTQKLQDLKSELFNLRFRHASGQLENPVSIRTCKRDIARVFNAETFMIGLLSGIIGVVFTCIVYFPANAILNAVLGIANLFQLVWWQLVGLVIISVVLTLISGFIPAHMAAKKDPVVALRSE